MHSPAHPPVCPSALAGVLGNILILAHTCNLPLDTFTHIHRTLPAPAAPPTPPFIAEWQHDPLRICAMRCQVEGAVSWQPNALFEAMIGSEAELLTKLTAMAVDVAANADFKVCTAEMFLAASLVAEDQVRLAQLNGLLWSSLTLLPNGTRTAEATLSGPVRCVVRNANGVETAACQLSGRSVVHPDSRLIFSVFSLTPRTPSPPATPMLHDSPNLQRALPEFSGTLDYAALEDLGLRLGADDFEYLLTD